MEDYNSHVNPDVKRVVQSFQSSAVRSLSGPNGLPLRTVGVLGHQTKMSAPEEDYQKAIVAAKKQSDEKNIEYDSPFLAPPPFPIQQMPVFTPVDTTKSERSDTILEGETIACFSVGGEKRLCLPQILNTVLRDFTLQQINAVCDDLHIFCSRCNQVQLETLKVLNILPSSAPSCGLITKTDAERLCNALLHGTQEQCMEPQSRNSFKIYHECFGKCKGLINPDTYTTPDAKCIRCEDCYGMFSPSKFVCHSHKSLENRTCHWGFDSANWRSYLLLAKDQNLNDNGRLQDAIEEIKARFDPAHKHKRRQSPERLRNELNNSKRIKTESDSDTDTMAPSPPQNMAWDAVSLCQLSAFQHWSPGLLSVFKEGKLIPPPAIMREHLAAILPSYLHTGPPVLLNPERVVPYSESERYERHFTPNVSLAPSSVQKSSADDEDDVDQKPCTEHSKTNIRLLPEGCSAKLVHSNSKGYERDGQDWMEYDVPTDTDDSNMASPTESSKDILLSDPSALESTLEREMEMVHLALNGKIDTSPEAQARFMQDFSKLRAKTEENLQLLIRANTFLKRELEATCRQKMQLEDLLASADVKLRKVMIEKDNVLKEKDQESENKIRNYESLYQQTYNENINLRRQYALFAESSHAKYLNSGEKATKSRLRTALDASLLPDSKSRQLAVEVAVKREHDVTVD
ncbi:unnamed protein product [Lymnaea stagnalis]|uniref:c-SKI SMAD4-binding domain-containing protein n=1 Tax=Lymnaea stagnalis TaxID=6523 RepID=A0AAV2ICG8_LYMST